MLVVLLVLLVLVVLLVVLGVGVVGVVEAGLSDAYPAPPTSHEYKAMKYTHPIPSHTIPYHTASSR